MTSNTRNTLMGLAASLEKKLLLNPTFIEWKAVLKLINEIDDRLNNPSLNPMPVATSKQAATGRITCASATVAALNDAGHPLGTRELLDVLPDYGFVVGGSKKNAKKDPASALASMLAGRNGSSPVHSIYINNKPYWWFKDRPVPVEFVQRI